MPFFTVRRAAPGLVLVAMILLSRVSILGAASPATVIPEYDTGQDSTCDTVVRTLARPVDAETRPPVGLTDDEVLRIADRVIARHRGDYWIGVYRYETEPAVVYLTQEGTDHLAFWVATATAVETTVDQDYRTGQSRVTLLFIDAITGDPLLLIDQAVFSRSIEARLLAGQYRACGYFTGDTVSPSDLMGGTPALGRLGARAIPLALLGIYFVWLLAAAARTIGRQMR
jgi:hypothetical protein